MIAAAHPKGPYIDWAALSPVVALLGASLVVLMLGLLPGRWAREQLVPLKTIAGFAVAIGCTIWQWDTSKDVVAGALRIDRLMLLSTLLISAAGIAGTLVAWRSRAAKEIAHGEFFSLLLMSAAGMVVLASAQNLVMTFTGLELLSLPLYILCASRMRSERSLESGLKYLIVGSVGSATLLYGFALIYGATGTTDYAAIAKAASREGMTGDVLFLTGVGLSVVGLAFKSSLAPFHQWTPDVYEGAPTPVTAFMSVGTKVAAFAAMVRLFDVALGGATDDWKPIWEVVAVASILVGNVGALGQSSLKRMLAYSSIAQAGYILVGFLVGTAGGVEAVIYYLIVYLIANLAAFAVVIARERETGNDDLASLRGLGASNAVLAGSMTIAMFSLAGIPATAGFIGKFNIISSAVDGDVTWLGIMIVVGSMISLAYYVPVISVIWRGGSAAPVPARVDPRTGLAALAGGSSEADELSIDEPEGEPQTAGIEVTATAFLLGVATLAFGIVPQPLFNLVAGAARGLGLG